MKSKYTLILFAIICLVFSGNIKSQNFKTSVLIDIPGNNSGFKVLQESGSFPYKSSMITWINKRDSVYSVIVGQLPFDSRSTFVVSSDKTIKSNPCISFDKTGQKIIIAWQAFENSYWKVYMICYQDSVVSDAILILDSLKTDPQLTLGNRRIGWINNGKLYVKEFADESAPVLIVDSTDCSSPVLTSAESAYSSYLLYLKKDASGKRVYLAGNWQSRDSVWKSELYSADTLCSDPKFGIGGGITYQAFIDSVWQIAYGSGDVKQFKYSGNKFNNYRHSSLFSYPVPVTKNAKPAKTPSFILFDSDSLKGNKEIFINTTYYIDFNNSINISNAQGDDEKPVIVLISQNDTIYIALIWEHTENGKTDIWIAVDKFDPIWGDVNDKIITASDFLLSQNYPNPFNPETTIKYSLSKESHVVLSVYNGLGQKVKELINCVKPAGNYETVFNASGLSSGIYFYQIRAGGFSETRKLILQK